MCSELYSRKGKSGGICSSPLQHTTHLSVTGKDFAGTSAPLSCIAHAHTILLIEVPSYRVQVFREPVWGADNRLLCSGPLHQGYMQRAATSGQISQYEWTMEQDDQTHTQQTTLLPLSGPHGKVDSIFSITRDISGWGSSAVHTLKEGTGAKTFAQILLAARETEKREISKALHDEIGSASVILSALMGLVRQDIEQKHATRALADLDKLHTQLQDCMNRLRGIIMSLRPPNLDTNGALRGSIEELTQHICQFGQISYQFDCAKNLREKGICDSIKIMLYRIVQEALNNVIKHARAKQVIVRLTRRRDELFLTVQDDGVGFVKNKSRSLHHIGLRSMHDSVRLLGGHLTIHTAPGKGTRIRVVCPCLVYEDDYENQNCISR